MTPRQIGVVLCVVAGASYGSVGIFGKLALDEGVGVPAMLATRFTIAAIILWTVVAIVGRPLRPTRRAVRNGLILGAVVYAAQAGFYFWSLTRLDAAFTILLVQIAPVLVAVGAVAFGRERLTRALIVSLPVALIGTALVAGAAPSGSADQIGIILALLCAVAYAAYMLASHVVVESLHPIPLAACVCSGTAGVFVVWAIIVGDPLPASAVGWTIIVSLAIVGTVIAISALAAGNARVGPSTAVLLETTEPLTATMLAYAVLGERLAPLQWVGATLVVAAVVAVSRSPSQSPPAH